MNKSWFHLGVISSLAILTTSCGGDSDKKAAPPTPSPSATSSPKAAAPAAVPAIVPAATPTVAATTPAKVPATTPAKSTPDKSVPAKPVSLDIAAGLIPPTDGENWARTVPKGRPDPFGALNLQPIESAPLDVPGQTASQPQQASPVKVKQSSVAKATPTRTAKVAARNTPVVKSRVSKLGSAIEAAPIVANKSSKVTNKSSKVASKSSKIPSKAGTVDVQSPTGEVALDGKNPSSSKQNTSRAIVAIKPVTQAKKAGSTPAQKNSAQATVALKPVPQPLKTGSTPSQVAPTAVQPTLARTVGISGIIQSGGVTQVIIKLPTESFSRYLEVGARMFDGKVKVKRVEGEQTLSPIVILEEAGIEVTRRVGDIPDAGASKEAQPK